MARKRKTLIATAIFGFLVAFTAAQYPGMAKILSGDVLIQKFLNEETATKMVSDARVIDGDTFEHNGIKIRLWGIDAPELHQTCRKAHDVVPCGDGAKVMLMGILKSGAVTCQKIDTDRYGRWVGRCKADDMDIGGLMVQAGLAFDYSTYSKGFYKDWEAGAKQRRVGLWGMQFDKPWDWRQGKRRSFK